jgi:hypothetical protein
MITVRILINSPQSFWSEMYILSSKYLVSWSKSNQYSIWLSSSSDVTRKSSSELDSSLATPSLHQLLSMRCWACSGSPCGSARWTSVDLLLTRHSLSELISALVSFVGCCFPSYWHLCWYHIAGAVLTSHAHFSFLSNNYNNRLCGLQSRETFAEYGYSAPFD